MQTAPHVDHTPGTTRRTPVAANRTTHLADGGPSKPGPASSGAPGEAEEQEGGKFDAILAEDTSTMRALRDGKVGSTATGRFTCAAPQALRNQLSRALVFPGAAEEFCAGLSPLLEETTVLLAALVPFVSRGAAGVAGGAVGGGMMEATSLIKTLLKVRLHASPLAPRSPPPSRPLTRTAATPAAVTAATAVAATTAVTAATI